MTPKPNPVRQLYQSHGRGFQTNRYIYPVISRRSGGLSIGVNLNLDKVCNFGCVYCQVDRTVPGERDRVDVARIAEELDAMLALVASGELFRGAKFRNTPEPLQRLNDVALSGDGEPTTCANFDEVVAACDEVLRRHRLDDVKLVLITNATMLHKPHVLRALEIFDRRNSEIWGKLDAGTEDYYQQVNRTSTSFQRILDNLRETAIVRPLVIQSLFMTLDGQPPSPDEREAYCDRLEEIIDAGGQIKLVQVHTVARPPAEDFVGPLSVAEVDAIGSLVRRRTGLSVATFYA